MDSGQLANRLNHLFVVIYTKGMQSIKPNNHLDPDYGKKIQAWDNAFEFTTKLHNYINDLSSMISLAGNENRSDFMKVTKEFIRKLQNELSSEEFEKNMEIAQPNINDPKLIKIWKTAFTFPKNLKDFGVEIEELLERLGGSMQLSTFLAKMKFFIEKIEEKLVT